MPAPRTTADAYDAFLRGRFFADKRSRADFERAIRHFDEAIALDSFYAPAWAGKAEALALQVGYGVEPGRQRLALARDVAQHALELDSGNAQAITALAFVDREALDLPAARRGFEKALQRDSNNVPAHQWLAVYFSLVGKQDTALQHIRMAQRLEPLSPIINRALGRHLFFARQYRAAAHQLRRTLELDSTFVPAIVLLGEVHLQLRDYDAAIQELERAVALSDSGSYALSRLVGAYAFSGATAKAKRLTEAMEGRAERAYVAPGHLAAAYCAVGERDRALRELERAYREISASNEVLAVDPWWDSLRQDPRFNRLLRSTGASPSS